MIIVTKSIPKKLMSAGVALMLILIMLQSSLAETQQRPNVLILLADDISASELGCYGAPNPGTSPNIDRLAIEGVRFDNMFVTSATCAPVRAELFTGLFPERNGVFRNHLPTISGTRSVAHYLADLGYRVGLAGKKHYSPASVYPFEYLKGICSKATQEKPPADDWTHVRQFMSRDSKEPFCLFICSIHAHAPWDAGDSSRWSLEGLKLPPSLADTEVTRRHYREFLAEVRMFDDQVGKAEQLLKELGLDENTVLIVLDENGTGMPGGKWSTFDWGVRSGCVMKWPASYKANFATDAIAQYCDILPTLIEVAGGAVPDSLDGKSLLPLIQGKTAEHRKYAYFSHINRHDHLKDPLFSLRAATDGRYKLIWNLTPGNMYATKNVNGLDYGDVNRGCSPTKIYGSWLEAAKSDAHVDDLLRRIRYYPRIQLFDLDKDPWELNDLANKPEHQSKIDELKTVISSWMKQQGDNGHLEGEGIKYSEMPFAESSRKPPAMRDATKQWRHAKLPMAKISQLF
jgi:N-sulfoglucosamine sulfohydrolase